MTVKREYRCNLCDEAPPLDHDSRFPLIGLVWAAGGHLTDRPDWRSVEHHICCQCLSALQDFHPICGAGVRGCKGGPKCKSAHE